jgi:hypothetical protein
VQKELDLSSKTEPSNAEELLELALHFSCRIRTHEKINREIILQVVLSLGPIVDEFFSAPT